jgi:hypothetical protein
MTLGPSAILTHARILALIDGAQVYSSDRAHVQALLYHAPFDASMKRASLALRVAMVELPQIPPLTGRIPSLEEHYYKRLVVSRQWSLTTTLPEFENDLRTALSDPQSRFVVYERGGLKHAGALCPNTIPTARLGVNAKPFIYIMYIVPTGVLLSGYQVDNSDMLSLGGNPIWLP